MEIKVNQVSKSYQLTQKAVNGLSLNIEAGEVLGFLGPNGAGKTTVMKMLTCYLEPDEGSINVGGFNTLSHPFEVKKSIGYLPENNPLYSDMTVIDHLIFSAKIQRVNSCGLHTRLEEIIKLCGLKSEKHKRIRELSKGYKQRVGLAQALIHNPPVLILDEPTTGLDPNQIVEIRELIRNIGSQKTVLLSSHILAEVEATCNRIVIIHQGKLVANGNASSLRKEVGNNAEVFNVRIEGASLNEATVALQQIEEIEQVICINVPQRQLQVKSNVGATSAKAIFNCCAANGWYIAELTPVESCLEDVFRSVTNNQDSK